MAAKPNDMRAGRVRSLLRELRPQPTITIGIGMPDDETEHKVDPLTGKPIPAPGDGDGAEPDPNADLFHGGDADTEGDAEHETETTPGPAAPMAKTKKTKGAKK